MGRLDLGWFNWSPHTLGLATKKIQGTVEKLPLAAGFWGRKGVPAGRDAFLSSHHRRDTTASPADFATLPT
jgi:hypothetical protein